MNFLIENFKKFKNSSKIYYLRRIYLHINQILLNFRNVKPNGNNSYMVQCPCHNDKKQSLSITEKDNKILLNCFCGCNTKDILFAVGLDMKDLYNDTNYNTFKTKPPKPADVTYFYTENIKKTRYYTYNQSKNQWDKAFCWYHKDDTGKWIKGAGTDKSKIPLYKQDLLLQVKNNILQNSQNLQNTQNIDYVYIVEGEKDVDTLTNNLGFVAVSSPNGASKGSLKSKWLPQYNELFRGLNVAIIQDNDEVGKQFARLVASQLVGIANTVKVINLCDEWSNVPEKADITDIYQMEKPNHIFDTVNEKVIAKLSALTIVTPVFDEAEYEEFEREFEQKFEPKTENLAKEKNVTTPVWTYEENNILKVNENLYVSEFIKNYGVRCINGNLFTVNGLLEDGEAEHIIIKDIEPYYKDKHANKTELLLKHIKKSSYSKPPEPSLDKIHFKNGTLSRDKNGLFTVFSAEKEFCINRINTDYNKNASKPTLFYKYLSEIYKAEDIKTLQQYCGYCLLPTNILQLALIIKGFGGEGKSTLGVILNGVIGAKNCHNGNVHELQQRFGVANIDNKLLFVDDDLKENGLRNTSIFKKIISSKTEIQAEVKGKQSNNINPYVRFLIFTNHNLQSLYDNSDGFYRRLLTIQTKPKNPDRTDNPFIDKEIIQNESAGVINWLIEGLNELILNNFKLCVSKNTQEESKKIKEDSDSVLSFIKNCDKITIIPNMTEARAFTKDLYKAYKNYCEDECLSAVYENSFSQRLENAGQQFGIKKLNNPFPIGARRNRGFCGIKINGFVDL